MCIIFLAYDKHPVYKLILASNRDEFYDRPTAAMQWWEDSPHILAGRDLKHNGTWLGISKSGKAGAITNYRDFSIPPVIGKSRGLLISDFLRRNVKTLDYLTQLELTKVEYDGYNILLYQNDKLYFQSNKLSGYNQLNAGIYGLSNASLDTPWPKVLMGKKLFEEIIEKKNFRNKLFDLLKDDTVFPDDKLPDTGIGLEKERWLSSIFIESENYGTVSSTVLTIDRDNKVIVEELTHKNSIVKSFEFQIKQ